MKSAAHRTNGINIDVDIFLSMIKETTRSLFKENNIRSTEEQLSKLSGELISIVMKLFYTLPNGVKDTNYTNAYHTVEYTKNEITISNTDVNDPQTCTISFARCDTETKILDWVMYLHNLCWPTKQDIAEFIAVACDHHNIDRVHTVKIVK